MTDISFDPNKGTSVFSPLPSQSLDTLVSYGNKLKSLNLRLGREHPDSISAEDLKNVSALSNLEKLIITVPEGPNVHITHDVITTIYIGCTKLKFVCFIGK